MDRCTSITLSAVLGTILSISTLRTSDAQIVCSAGMAGAYPCSNTTMMSYMSALDLGATSANIAINDVWGWTDPDSDREYALVGHRSGTSFVDVTDPVHPVLAAVMPTNSANNPVWRDIKVYRNHAYVVADAAGEHGMQVFDLTRLRGMSGVPEVVEPDTVYAGIASAHNIVINEDTGFAYAVGSNSGGTSCAGGLHMIDIQNPLEPTFVGCQIDATIGRGYTHDAQCVMYHGPDTAHQGSEVCFNSNEDGVNIADVSDKSAPVTLAFPTYPSASYVHQGWLTEDHKYFYQDDEADERDNGTNTRTMIWDVTDLDDPVLAATYVQGTVNIDHNLYVRGDLLFEANYTAGLRVFDISDREEPRPVASFDTWPSDNAVGYSGAWSNYPYFASGNILVSSSNGLFVVRTPALLAEGDDFEIPESSIDLSVFPNPYAGEARVRVVVDTTITGSVVVFDLLGREVSRLFDGTLAGNRPFEFTLGASIPSGVYVVTVVTEVGRKSTNVVKLR